MAGAGRLDRRIQIEQYGSGRDQFGAPIKTWLPFATIPAQRMDASDAERMGAGGQEAVRVTRWKIRSTAQSRQIDTTFRLRHRGQTYEITGMSETPEGRNRYLWLSTVVRSDETIN